jgi:hypothetical protein
MNSSRRRSSIDTQKTAARFGSRRALPLDDRREKKVPGSFSAMHSSGRSGKRFQTRFSRSLLS